MALKRLTDITTATGVTLSDYIHIVITGDTSQNAAGSSYKVTLGQIYSAFNITGSTGSGTDYYVTGGTYSSGTLTLDRQNGSVTITGFTSGTDFYVTGGTFNSGTNTLTLDRQNGSITITGFTSGTSGTTNITINYFGFSGSSASCITDLYVTNLYGCSPITFYDSIQSVGTVASGTSSFAFGSGVITSGNYSHAEGNSTTSIGDYSHAKGEYTIAIGQGSHAEGGASQSIGTTSHAEGQSTVASGSSAHSEGFLTTAIGTQSHSEGFNTTAIGNRSHAEGRNTVSIGLYSHTEGFSTTAIGPYSHTEGYYTVANGNHQHVSGMYNVTGNTTQGAFIIGNGASDLSRSNLIFAGGNGSAAVVEINGKLDVSGTTGYNQFRMRTSYTPSGSADSNGQPGDISWDDNFFYWRTSTQWLRISGETW